MVHREDGVVGAVCRVVGVGAGAGVNSKDPCAVPQPLQSRLGLIRPVDISSCSVLMCVFYPFAGCMSHSTSPCTGVCLSQLIVSWKLMIVVPRSRCMG